MPSNAAAIRLALFVLLATGLAAQQAAPSAAEPVTPNASPEARALLRYMYSISGRYILTGQHTQPRDISRWTEVAREITGKYPALFGEDFGFGPENHGDSIFVRPNNVEEIKRLHKKGSIITLTWHAVRPTHDEPVLFDSSILGRISDFEWNELLTPGTNLYARWCEQVDVVAGFLKQLRDARVPVLWRPYHEMNGKWFWWGGRKGARGSAAIYRQLFDRLVNYHKLNNLVWVWNANAPRTSPDLAMAYADFFPGLEYADMLSADVYNSDYQQSHYEGLLALAGGKPIALGEVGTLPTPEILKRQPKWTYFMTWAGMVRSSNKPELVKAVYEHPPALTLEDPRFIEGTAGIRAAAQEPSPEPVTPDPLPQTTELVRYLHRISGKQVFSGQQNQPLWPSRWSDRVNELTGKFPAIFAQDFGFAKSGDPDTASARAAVIEEAKRQHAKGAIVSLSWIAPRPTDDGPVTLRESVSAKLSDFEWAELLTPGTNLYDRWCAQVDAIAAHLKELQRTGVPVLWRPYPDSNGASYWWAGRRAQRGQRGSVALYRQIFDRLVNHHKLKNLVWVWTAAAPRPDPDPIARFVDYFPGLTYVDVLAANVWEGDFKQSFHDDLALLATGKPIALGAPAVLPSPRLFDAQPKWTWILAGADLADRISASEAIRELYKDSRLLSRGDPKGGER